VSNPYLRYEGATRKSKAGLQFTVTKRPPGLKQRAIPSDSDYQRGYLAALLEVYRTVLRGPSTVEAAEKLTQAEE
jgi:hypothetical protein